MRALHIYFIILLATGAQAQALKLELVRTFIGHDHGVRKVVFSENGKLFASGDTRGGIRVWSVDDGAIKFTWNEHYGAVLDLQFSRSGDKLVSAGSDGQLMIFDLTTGKIIDRLDAPNDVRQPVNNVNFARFSLDGNSVYFGGTNTYVCVKKIGSSTNGKVIHVEKKTILTGDVSPDGQFLTVGAEMMIMTFNLKTNELVREFNTGDCGVNALRYAANGKKLLTWCANSRVDVRDPNTLGLLTSFRSGSGARKFSNLFFTQDQRYVITGDHASRFTVWDLSNRELVLDQSTEQGTIMAFDMQDEPNYLLSGSLDKTVKLWRIVEVNEEEEKQKRKRKNDDKVEPELIIVEEHTVNARTEKETDAVAKSASEVREETELEPVIVKTETRVETDTTDPASVVEDIKESKVEPEVKGPKVANFTRPPDVLNGRRVLPIRHEHRIELASRNLTFKVWDDQVVDGDIISLYVNDQEIISNYSITASQKVVSFNAAGLDKCYVFLHAHNLGRIPPNSVTMSITDGQNLHKVNLRSDLNGSAALELMFD